jgi:glutaredoxin-related protein
MARIDLQLQDNDIVILDNDFVLGESDSQHIEDTISANVGWWKENYTDGVGIKQYLKSKDSAALIRAIKMQLSSDGYVCNPIVSFENGQLIINPNVSL